MNKEELILEQYKIYTEQKEKFVERSFMTNKFYLFLVLVLILMVFITNGLVYGRISATMCYSIAGMAICALWWINIDSYNFLLKIKFRKVIEELEKKLPINPYTLEFEAIKEYRKNKRMFLFSDIQKLLAILSFLLFFILLLMDLIPILLGL